MTSPTFTIYTYTCWCGKKLYPDEVIAHCWEKHQIRVRWVADRDNHDLP